MTSTKLSLAAVILFAASVFIPTSSAHAQSFSIIPPTRPDLGLDLSPRRVISLCPDWYTASDIPTLRTQLTARSFTISQAARFAQVAVFNLLPLGCKMTNVETMLGGPAAHAFLNDDEPHNAETRNHTLYQRTIDLERSIESLRMEVRQLSTALRTQNSMNGITGNQSNFFYAPPQEAPAPQETFYQAPTPSVPSKQVANEDCLNECSASKIMCIKAAGTSKAMQQCQTDETACIASCQ